MLPSFPLGMQYCSVLKAGWLQRPERSSVFKSSQIFLDFFLS